MYLKEAESTDAILSPVKPKEPMAILNGEKSILLAMFSSKASVAATESQSEDVTDPRCLICSPIDGTSCEMSFTTIFSR